MKKLFILLIFMLLTSGCALGDKAPDKSLEVPDRLKESESKSAGDLEKSLCHLDLWGSDEYIPKVRRCGDRYYVFPKLKAKEGIELVQIKASLGTYIFSEKGEKLGVCGISDKCDTIACIEQDLCE